MPEGVCWIGKQYTPGGHAHDATRGGDYEWFSLWGDNGAGGKSYDSTPVKNPKTGAVIARGYFNLHTGAASDGCITVSSDIPCGAPEYPHSSNYDRLKDFIQRGSEPLSTVL